MRELERFGEAYRVTGGRTVKRSEAPGNAMELLESPDIRLSFWRERKSPQRWVSLEILGGELLGVEVFVPIEAFLGREIMHELRTAVAEKAFVE